VFAGLALNGISISFIFVPLLPEILYVVGTAEGLSQDNDLNDKASGIYNVAYASGTIIAPNIGGILASAYGFRTMCDILALLSLTFSFIFLFANVGLKTFCNIKPDPRLEEPKKKRGSVAAKSVDSEGLTNAGQALLDKQNINRSELTHGDTENYANASAKYAN